LAKLSLVIEGNPTPKNRPRFAVRGKRAIAYSDQKKQQALFRAYILAQLPDMFQPWAGPVSIKTVFYRVRPKSHYGTGKNAERLKASAPGFLITAPDLDNYEKFVWDCLNGVVWVDDRQIVSCSSEKRFSENPRTEIFIHELLRG